MKFTAKRIELLNAAKITSKIIPVGSPIDSIKGLLFSVNAEKGIVEITGTDIRTRITKRVPISDDTQSGAFVINPIIREMLSRMAGEEVTFDNSFSGLINISCGTTVYELPFIDAKEFPLTGMTFPQSFITVNGLNTLIKKCSFATDKTPGDSSIKQNIRLTLHAGESISEATDGNRMVCVKSEGISDGELTLFLHNSAINAISPLLSGKQTMYVGISKQSAVFFNSDTIISTMTMSGSFPDMNTFLSQISPDYKAQVNTDIFKNALESAICCQLSDDDSCINIVFEGNKIQLKAEAYNRKSVLSVDAICNTPTSSEGFNYNPRYILDYLNLCSDVITLTINKKGYLLVEDDTGKYMVSPRNSVSIQEPKVKEKKKTEKKETAKKQTKITVKKAA